MPPVETALDPAGAVAAPIPSRVATLSGWGGADTATVRLLRPRRLEGLQATLAMWRGEPPAGAIARGMGRCYGDAAQLEGGQVIDMTGLSEFALDPDRGILTAQAGITIGELLDALVPRGWVVPVVPGTQHVTVGGAIASDIHGKNHGVAGTFGSHVEALGLMTADGELHELERGEPSGLFDATIGGMGLTGVIVWARVALRRVGSALLSVDTDRARDLDEALALLSGPGGPHRVAWLDLLGSSSGRGIVTRADHLDAGAVAGPAVDAGRARATVAARATVPAGFPGGAVRPATIRAFNELRFRRAPRHEQGHVEPFGAHMFPLDALRAWPRLYGPRGFVQYQLVVPPGEEAVLHQVIDGLRRAAVPCYLAVLKDFGPANDAPLSFPIAGWTLALDLPRSAPGLWAALDRCDELVAGAGGRVYLTKDSRLRPDAVRAMYPRLAEWRATRERADPSGLWRSDLAERTGLVEAAAARGPSHPQPTRVAEQRVLLIGGTSEIGLAIVRRLRARGAVRPHLIGRDRPRLEAEMRGLERAGCAAGGVQVVDADDVASHQQAIATAFEAARGFDFVIVAVGVLGGQAGLDSDPEEAIEVMQVNFLGAGSLMFHALRRMRDQGGGTLIVLSSVAAERPRAGNPIYGAAKSGLDALAQGLADATAGSGTRVLVVRPGFVTTRMTEGLEPAPLATTPEAVAEAAVQALGSRAHTVWVPPALRPMFAVLRHLPRPIFRRLPL